jgi:cytochrome b
VSWGDKDIKNSLYDFQERRQLERAKLALYQGHVFGSILKNTMPNRAQSPSRVYVWDALVRAFHWILVAAFAIAYVAAPEPVLVHVWAGYAVGILLLLRVVWGFLGSPHARFADFIYSPAATLRYVKDLVRFRAPRYLGHSPGGGAMIVLLLVSLGATVVTGLIVYGGDQQAGPLAGIVTKATAENLEDWHELIANFTLGLVLVHVAAVILASFAHHENLVRAMITGYKRA